MTSERPQEETPTTGASSPLPAEIEDRVYGIWFDGAPAERDAAIAALCERHPEHAAAIRERASHLARSDDLLGDVAATVEQPAVLERIGPYVIREQIGAGGFGVVFRAEQTEPVHRTVALKLLHPSRLHEQAIARFEVERQTLAAMEHPAIAHVYDFGTAPDGRPFFAMELVPGTPITAWCDANRLDLTARIRLFLRVCSGVHHAHQRGVVHRDIKPSNVLVHEQDGEPVPKIIDFGVAKLLEPDADVHTTLEGSLIGTLEYMSPEQAAGLDIDTRTDVFALGVLLYELLTGRLHFDRHELRGRGLAELARHVAENEPRRPSTAFQRAADADAVAHRRSASVETVLRHLRNDLDWILLRALQNDREQRYGSVGAFAQDLERHLRDEPVSARAPTAGYLARKFVRRHRAGVAIAAGMLLALLTAFAGVVWGLVEARVAGEETARQRDEAELSGYAARMAAGYAALRDGVLGELRAHLEASPENLRGWEWRHLAARLDESEAVLQAGVGEIHAVAAAAGGEVVYVAGSYGGLEAWSIAEARLLARAPLEGRVYPRLAVSPDGSRLAVVDRHGHATLHELPSLAVLHELAPASDGTGGSGIAWSRDGSRIAIGDPHGGLTVRDTNGAIHHVFRHPGNPEDVTGIVVVAFDPNGERVAGGSIQGTIRVWDLADERPPLELVGHSDEVMAVQFTPDGERLLGCSVDGSVRRWNLATGEQLGMAEPPQTRLFDLAIDAESERVLVIGGWGVPFVAVFDDQLRSWRALNGHQLGCNGIALVAGDRFATGSRDGTVRIWRLDNPPRPVRLDTGRGYGSIAFAPDGRQVVTSSVYGRIGLWDLRARTELAHIETDGRAILVAWDHERSRVLAAVRGELVVLDDHDLSPERDSVPDLAAFDVTTAPGSAHVLVGTWSGEVAVLTAADLVEVTRVQIGRGYVRVTMTAAGARCAAIDDDGRIVVFEPNGRRLREFQGQRTNYSLAFAPAGDRLAFDSGTGVVRIVDCESGSVVQEIPCSPTIGVCWSPDGARLATGGIDGRVRLLDAERGQELLALHATSQGAVHPVFDPTGQRLAASVGALHRPTQAVIWWAPDEVELPR